MASSQVEIASSPRFGCVLRDHNRRDGCRDTNARFQKNLKNFVRDHLNTCISISSDTTPDENTHNQINNADSWVGNGPKNDLGNLRFTSNNREKVGESSFGGTRHSSNLDRWAARQAREMMSTIETEAKLLALPSSEPSCRKEECPSSSSSSLTRTSSGISNLGASSLVQIWEKRLNKSNSTKLNASPNNGRSSPNASPTDNPFSMEEQCIDASASGEPVIVNEESFPDYESDKTSSLQRQNSDDSAESERVRVADIIKKLTASDDNDHEQSSNVTGSPSRERERAPTPELAEQRVFLQVTNSPRLRGRQAFNDLLMQIDRDRHGELHNLAERAAVSKFTQKGRIQSLLRLKLLQRDVAAHGQSRQQFTPSPMSRHPQGSSIMQLRERFSTGAEHGTTSQAEVAEQGIPRPEIAKNITQLDNSKKCNRHKKDTPIQIVHSTDNQSTAPAQSSVTKTRADDNKDEAHPSLDVKSQPRCSKAKNIDSQNTVETTPQQIAEEADAGNERNATADTSSDVKLETSGNQQTATAKTSYDSTIEEASHLKNAIAEPSYVNTIEESSYQQNATAETSYDDIIEEEEANYQQYAESSYDDMLDEVDASEQNYDESSYDWISQISRPRSYWEDQRKAWYNEVLDTGSHNEEIRQLLERRTVSNFLASDFRERMDRLMVSHIDTQTQLACSEDDDEDRQGRKSQLISFLQEHMRPSSNHEEGGRERGVEEEQEQHEEEEESLINGQYTDVNDYYNLSSSPSSSPLRTWSYRDNETGDDSDRVNDSDRVMSPSSPQPSQSHSSRSQSSYQDNRQYSSSANHHSIEMELICDLRGQMGQLYQEMSELRKSIKSCIDMQMMLQKSMNRQALTVKNEEKESLDRKRKKGNCCICYEKKVDSLLYRCGHMCACIKCANELQWNSGKCPICRAPILDVVRVYVDT